MADINVLGALRTAQTFGVSLEDLNSFDVAGTPRAAVTYGIRIFDALVAPADITAELFRLPDLQTPVIELDQARARQWVDGLSDCGAGSLLLQNDDGDLPLILPLDVVGFSYKGERAWSMLVERFEPTTDAQDEESAEITLVSGRGLAACLQWMIVDPAGGPDRQPVEYDRAFNWTSILFPDTGWVGAKVICSAAVAKLHWDINLPIDENFPDDTASCLWDSHGAISGQVPPGEVYGRQFVTIPASTNDLYELSVVCDNEVDVYVDGQHQLHTADWPRMSTSQLTMSAGSHLVAWKGINYGYNPSGNPAMVVWSLHQAFGNGVLGSLVAHSNGTCKILAYPAQAPGMAVGRAILMCVAENQLEGVLPDLVCSFTNDVDSAGQPWPVVADIATRIGTDLYTWIFQELASVYVDAEFDPASLTLHAWNIGTKGRTRSASFHIPTDPEDESTGNLTGLSFVKDVSTLSNDMLVSYAGGWHRRTRESSVDLYGRIRVKLGLGSLNSIAEVERWADSQLDIFGDPREQVTAGVLPRDASEDAYLALKTGDYATVTNSDGDPALERLLEIGISEDEDGNAVPAFTFKDVVLEDQERFALALKKMVS